MIDEGIEVTLHTTARQQSSMNFLCREQYKFYMKCKDRLFVCEAIIPARSSTWEPLFKCKLVLNQYTTVRSSSSDIWGTSGRGAQPIMICSTESSLHFGLDWAFLGVLGCSSTID
jgi:hypothetical protein